MKTKSENTQAGYQAEINKYITALKKFSKNKLINRVVSLTVECANLQADVTNLMLKLKEYGNENINNNSNDKTNKRSIITTD